MLVWVPEVSRMGEVRRRSSGGSGTASLGLDENQGIDLSKVESLDGEETMYSILQKKDGDKDNVSERELYKGIKWFNKHELQNFEN